jgi:hypothetical protein
MSDNLTNQLNTRLTGSLSTAFNSQNNLPISKTILSTVVPLLSKTISKDISQTVNKEANFSLNEIPKNLVGPKNPVDLVGSNLTASDLNDTLSGSINTNVNDQVSTDINRRVDEVLRLNLPGGSNNVNLNSLKSSILGALQKDQSRLISTALSNFSNGVFNTGTQITPVVTGIDTLFNDGNAEAGVERYNDQYNSAIVSKALSEARNFDVNNADNTAKLEVTKTGFTDPTATYPTKEYAGRPDTNKLATGDVNGTVVQKKNEERMVGAKLPGGESWSQPESPYKGEYPYNKVTQTESGHIIEIDDTPGAERLHVYHKSGTFIEIDSNGSTIKRTKGSSYEIIDRNGKISIAGKADISVNGACNIFVGNDANIEVEGDTNIICHNDITAQAGGTFNLSSVETFSIRSSNVYIEADVEMNLKSGNVTKINSNIIHSNAATAMYMFTNDYYGKIDNDYFNEVAGDKHDKVTGDVYISSDNLYLKQDTSSFIETGSDQHYLSGGALNIDTDGLVNLAGGLAENSVLASESRKADKAEHALIGILSGRKDISIVDIPDPMYLTLADTYVLSAEEPTALQSEVNATKNKAIQEGIVSKSEMNETPVALDSVSPTTNNSAFILPGAELKSITEAPDNFNLSPNFTLGMLSSKAAVSKYKLAAQAGKTYGELLYNLSGVALNICEPVLKLYPNMYVTSSFRSDATSKTSQHRLGQAVDIQFKGISKATYFEIAKILATKLNYDQLLLEYASTTMNPWIHVSLDINNRNRSQVMTFNNHAKYSDGLSQLA